MAALSSSSPWAHVSVSDVNGIMAPSSSSLSSSSSTRPWMEEEQDSYRGGLFTCLSCQIGFHSADLQRQHFRTDWHRYNLKRKIAELPPVTAEVFAQKVLAQQDQARLSASQENYQQTCVPCKKTFYSQNAYNNHLSSKRHRIAMLRAPNRIDVLRGSGGADNVSVAGSVGSGTVSLDMMDSVSSLDERDVRTLEDGVNHMEIVDEEDEVAAKMAKGEYLPPDVCIFCLHPSSTLEENVSHMNQAHGLFIPEREYLTDLRGLVVYLGEKVGVGNVCMYCGKSFTSGEGARAHMIDKGHCKIPYSTTTEMLEYSDYYDFSTSYPTKKPQVEEEEQANVMEDDNDSNWSDDPDSDTSSIASDDLRPVQVEHDILELRLPHLGKRLGHRSLARYYRQNLRPEKLVTQGEQTHRLMIENGPSSMVAGGRTAVGVRKFGDRSMMVEVSKRRHAEREARRFRDQREKEQFRIGVAFRKTAEFKKYYRDPLLQ